MANFFGSKNTAGSTVPNTDPTAEFIYDGVEQLVDFTAVKGHIYTVDVRNYAGSKNINITPPPLPALGDAFAITDGRFAIDDLHTVTVLTSSDLLWGKPDVLVLREAGIAVTLRYYGTVLGWCLQF